MGAVKGLLKQIISILSAIIGIILALAYYPYVAAVFKPLSTKASIANFLAFLALFFAVLILGWVVARMFSQALKGSFKLMNHIGGAVLGMFKGVLICGVIVFAMVVFPVNIDTVKESVLAPQCVRMTMGVVDLIPKELKKKVEDAYRDFKEGGKEHA